MSKVLSAVVLRTDVGVSNEGRFDGGVVLGGGGLRFENFEKEASKAGFEKHRCGRKEVRRKR